MRSLHIVSILSVLFLSPIAFGQTDCDGILSGGVFNLYQAKDESTFVQQARRILEMSDDQIREEMKKGDASASLAIKLFKLGGSGKWDNTARDEVRKKLKIDTWDSLDTSSKKETYHKVADEALLATWLECRRFELMSKRPVHEITGKCITTEGFVKIILSWSGPRSQAAPKVTSREVVNGEITNPSVFQIGSEVGETTQDLIIRRHATEEMAISINTDTGGAFTQFIESQNSIQRRHQEECNRMQAEIDKLKDDLALVTKADAAKANELEGWKSATITLFCYDDANYNKTEGDNCEWRESGSMKLAPHFVVTVQDFKQWKPEKCKDQRNANKFAHEQISSLRIQVEPGKVRVEPGK